MTRTEELSMWRKGNFLHKSYSTVYNLVHIQQMMTQNELW